MFKFLYYIGQTRTLNYDGTNPNVKTYTSQLLPSGCYKQRDNVTNLSNDFDLTLADKYANCHILGRNHIDELNSIISPLKGYRLKGERKLYASTKDGKKYVAFLNEHDNLTIELIKSNEG